MVRRVAGAALAVPLAVVSVLVVMHSRTPGSTPASDAPAASAAGPEATPGAGGPRPTTRSRGVDVRRFGASGNGVTDDAPALRRALAAGRDIHVPAGTYLLKSYLRPRPSRIGADFVFSLSSGQRITADPHATFKMGDRVITRSLAPWGGNVFLADHAHDIAISGLTVDMNGAANRVPSGRTISGYGLYLDAAQRVLVDGVTMRDTPGQNYVVAQNGGSDITVRNSTFLNGGTSLPGNVAQKDFSALYFTATRVRVDSILIDHDSPPFTFSGGVELHGSSESVTNSVIRRSWPAVYVGPDSHVGLGVQRNTTVRHNDFLDSARGVIFNAGGTGDIDGVDISLNRFRLTAATAFPKEPARGIDQDRPGDGRWVYHHTITRLRVESNDIVVTDSPADALIRLSQVHSATIADNRIHGANGGVLLLGSSPWGLSGVTFRGNVASFHGTPTAPVVALSFDGSSTLPPVAAFAARDVRIEDNTFLFATRSTKTCGIFASWAAAAAVTGVTAGGNHWDNVGRAVCGPMGPRVGTRP